jgi:hypothetical protein
MNTRSNSPDAAIVFYPYLTGDTDGIKPEKANNLETKAVWAVSDIISVSTDKQKGQVGRWTCTLSSNNNWRSLLHPGCWCLIYIGDNRSIKPGTNYADSGLKMVGIVKSIRTIENIDQSTGVRTITYQISGDDFHSVLHSQVYLNPFLLTMSDNGAQVLARALVLFEDKFRTLQKPDEFCKNIIAAVLGDKNKAASNGGRVGGVYCLPPQVSQVLLGKSAVSELFIDVLNLFFQSNLIGKINLQPDTGSFVSLWSLLQVYSHPILNELYTDLFVTNRGGKSLIQPGVVLRALPFNSLRLKKSNIDPSVSSYLAHQGSEQVPVANHQLYVSARLKEEDIYSVNLGKSDAERFNFFMITAPDAAKGLNIDNFSYVKITSEAGGIDKLADANSLKRHGLRPYVTHTTFSFDVLDKIGTVNKIVRDMWERAHLYLNGQVTCRGLTQCVPVGTNIIFEDRGWIGHIEGVSHNFVVSPDGTKRFTTNLACVRLCKKGGKFIDDVERDSQRNEHDRGVNEIKTDQEHTATVGKKKNS